MLNEELKAKIIECLPKASFEDAVDLKAGDWLSLTIEPSDWPAAASVLFNNESLRFDYLFCLTCIDWKTHLTMVYHLSSTTFRHQIVVKSKLDRSTPQIESVSNIWQTANFHEREVYEMFGVDFINHPDLRLLILPDGWEGKNPMRKDFEDVVNMIKL